VQSNNVHCIVRKTRVQNKDKTGIDQFQDSCKTYGYMVIMVISVIILIMAVMVIMVIIVIIVIMVIVVILVILVILIKFMKGLMFYIKRSRLNEIF
jgi:hypothetical protein